MLHQIIFWLQSRRLVNLLLVFAYFAFIILMHHPLVLLSIWVERNISLPVYNLVVAAIFLVLLSLLAWYVLPQLIKHKQNQKLTTAYFLSTVLLLFIHSRFMFDSNIEVIHSLEFTFLAFLLFPFTRRFGAAILFTLPFMLIDEWYQYILLYPEWNDYFDLNDILTDTYGCGLTMVALIALGVKGDENTKPVWKRTEFLALAGLVALVLVLAAACFIVPYANEACSNTLLIMNERTTPEPFIRAHPTHNISYHVMKPVEGLVAIVLLHLFYFGLDSFRNKKSAP